MEDQNLGTFMMDLLAIQPSQLYISEMKLDRLLYHYKFDPHHLDAHEPLPIFTLDHDIIFTDGHTRALLYYQHGIRKIPVVWDTDELDLNLYRLCVSWCKQQKISNISNLQNRTLPHDQYEIQWIEKCQNVRRGTDL